MKGKLTPKEAFVLYGAWIVVAFGLFLLGLYWGRGQVTAFNQEISNQPAGAAAPAVPGTQVQTRLDLANRQTPPVVGNQQVPAPLSPSPGGGRAATEVEPPITSPGASAAPPAKPPAVPVTTPGKEIFSIQVGALNTEEEARKVIVRLQTRGYTGILDKPVSQKDAFYRVRVGSYLTREEAARAEALLKDEGFLTFIKKIK